MRKKVVWWTAMAVYLAVLLRITVFRPGAGSGDLFSGALNLEPFAQYMMFARYGSWSALFYYLIGNLIVFVPVGYLISRLKDARWQKAAVYGFLISLLIEIGQYVLGSRVCETDDLVLNTVGALMGYGLGRLLSHGETQ